MTDKELALVILDVPTKCPFVSEVNQTGRYGWVNVKLTLSIAQHLPHSRRVLQIHRDNFTVDMVWEVYEHNIVIWAQEGYDKAVDMARRPKSKR